MPTPQDAPGLAALFVADDLAAVQSELVAAFPSTFGDAHSLNQATDADKPTMQATGIGGRKGLSFDGISDRLIDDVTTLLNNVAGATFYSVFSLPALPGGSVIAFGLSTDQTTSLLTQVLLSVTTAGEFRAGGRRVSADSFVGHSAVGVNVADGAPHIGCVIHDYAAGRMHVYVDGTNFGSVALTTAGNTSAAGRARMAMGLSAAGASNFWPGIVAMGSVYHAAHSAADRAKVHTWAQDTYGIPVADYVPAGTPPQSARPTSTVTAGGWAATGAATLHEALNETVSSDTEFIDVWGD